MGAGGRRRRPLSFYSTDVENPRRAYMVGCVTQLLLTMGCMLTFGSAYVIIQGTSPVRNSVLYVGFVMLGVGVVLVITSFIVCGKVLKHSCCHPGKPILGHMHGFTAGGMNSAQQVHITSLPPPQTYTQPYAQPFPQTLPGPSPHPGGQPFPHKPLPGYSQPPGGQPLAHQPLPGYSQTPAGQPFPHQAAPGYSQPPGGRPFPHDPLPGYSQPLGMEPSPTQPVGGCYQEVGMQYGMPPPPYEAVVGENAQHFADQDTFKSAPSGTGGTNEELHKENGI